jgi:hypothetical protein
LRLDKQVSLYTVNQVAFYLGCTTRVAGSSSRRRVQAPCPLRLAQSWALVVSVAHLISGLDVVKRLKDIDRKLSLLVAGRRIDQDAALNRIYTEARGILNQKIDLSVVRELKKYRYDLYQLRQVWRGEISELVRSTELPDRSGWHHSSWWRRDNREREAVAPLAARG